MPDLLDNPMIQYGAMGLAFVLVLAFVRAFFSLSAQRHELQCGMIEQNRERERLFAGQFTASIDRNTAALEKVEQGLQRLHVELARSERTADCRVGGYGER